MNAKEVRQIAKKRAPIVEAEEKKFQIEQKKKQALEEKRKHSHWRIDFEAKVRKSISYASKNGKLQTIFLIEDDGKNVTDFMKRFEFAKDIERIIAKLKAEGFKVVLTTQSVEHDERSAYMNSGGECGSETIWWTSDVVLKIDW